MDSIDNRPTQAELLAVVRREMQTSVEHAAQARLLIATGGETDATLSLAAAQRALVAATMIAASLADYGENIHRDDRPLPDPPGEDGIPF